MSLVLLSLTTAEEGCGTKTPHKSIMQAAAKQTNCIPRLVFAIFDVSKLVVQATQRQTDHGWQEVQLYDAVDKDGDDARCPEHDSHGWRTEHGVEKVASTQG